MTTTCGPGRAQLVEEVRALAAQVVRGSASEAQALELASVLRGWNDRWATAGELVPQPQTPWFWALPPETRDGSSGWFRDNPSVPPVHLVWQDGRLSGRVRVPVPFTGPAGRVHGGFVAAILDHLLAHLLVGLGRQSMTTDLHVSYLRATPLDVDLDLRAGCEEQDGRRTTAWAEIHHHGQVTARATGTFVAVSAPAHASASDHHPSHRPGRTTPSLERSTTP